MARPFDITTTLGPFSRSWNPFVLKRRASQAHLYTFIYLYSIQLRTRYFFFSFLLHRLPLSYIYMYSSTIVSNLLP